MAAADAPAQTAAPASARTRILSDYSAAMEDLARSASPAVVQIRVQALAPLKKGDSERLGFVSEEEATGSGVIVDPSGYIVTNAHVVQNASHINVKILFSDTQGEEPHGHLLPAKLVGLDSQVDIAVVKIEKQNLPTLSFRDSDTLRQGQFVLAVGSPLGLQNSLTHGVISATMRQLDSESPMVYVQTDAPINPGNSGGPLLDAGGQIAGINTMIFSQSGGNEGIGFAIPANLAKDTYLRLRKDGHIHRGIIGVIPDTITPTMAVGLGLSRDSGVILSDVAPSGPAAAAGLQPGDIIVAIGGKPMREARDLGLAVFQRAPGDELHMDILRGTQPLSMTVVILERPHEPGQLADLANDAGLIRSLGILAVTVDDKVRAILPDLRHSSGVAVAAVPAEFAGLNPGLVSGDVIYSLNNKPVASVDELRAALTAKKSGDPIVFFVERQGQLIYVTATLE
ncbi:MAG: trypsin-like peptidase domain-containing protein [Acidobacteria bacterium]|nr:trypsin-like peptidase domain-containing protein [Acidobacteriota bacterium]